MVRMIFEDHYLAAISKMIRCAYGEDNDDTKIENRLSPENSVWFAEDNGRVLSIIENKCTKDDFYLIFIDLIPDNIQTLILYKKVIGRIEKKGLQDNTVVLPIRGIEYYVLKVYLKLYEDVNISEKYKIIDYKRISKSKNLENYYKSLLVKIGLDCFIPKVTNNEVGAFYNEDCLCRFSKLNCRKCSRMTKAKMLVESLPLYKRMDESIGTITREEIGDIVQGLLDDYKSLKNTYEELGYNIG